jgi:hemerythrin-like domain-containing protein
MKQSSDHGKRGATPPSAPAESKKQSSQNRSEGNTSRQRREQVATDATELLTKDHDRVKALFAQFQKAGDNSEKKITLFETVKSELQVHTKIEEEIFYPAVARLRSSRAKNDIKQARVDHEEVDELLNELESLTPKDSEFDDKMTELMNGVQAHIKLEQDEVFEVARTGLGAEELKELGAQMTSLKESEKQKMDSEEGDEE